MIQTMWQQLRRQFFSSRVVVQTRAGLTESEDSADGQRWVMGRDCCLFRTVDVAGVPAGKMDAVVRAQAELVSPFAEPGIFWLPADGRKPSQDRVNVWIWDEAKRIRTARERQLNATDFQVIPESCFTQESEGISFTASQGGGVIGVYRLGDCVLADTWWPEVPGRAQWLTFLRGISVDSTLFEKMPEVAPAPSRWQKPWSGIRIESLQVKAVEQLAWQGTLLIFFFLFSFQATGSIRLLFSQQELSSQVAEAETRHESTISVRNEALAARDRARQLSQLAQLNQLSLLGQVAEQVEGRELRVWRFADSQLEVVVRDPAPDLEDYVRRLESLPWVKDVNLEPLDVSGELRVRMGVR